LQTIGRGKEKGARTSYCQDGVGWLKKTGGSLQYHKTRAEGRKLIYGEANRLETTGSLATSGKNKSLKKKNTLDNITEKGQLTKGNRFTTIGGRNSRGRKKRKGNEQQSREGIQRGGRRDLTDLHPSLEDKPRPNKKNTQKKKSQEEKKKRKNQDPDPPRPQVDRWLLRMRIGG